MRGKYCRKAQTIFQETMMNNRNKWVDMRITLCSKIKEQLA